MKGLRDVARGLETGEWLMVNVIFIQFILSVVAPDLAPGREEEAVRGEGLGREDQDLEERKKPMAMAMVTVRRKNLLKEKRRMAIMTMAKRVLRKTLRIVRRNPSLRNWSLRRRMTV